MATTPNTRYLTVADICTELQIARSTWDDWKAKGRTPRLTKLPNGQIRIRRADYDKWLTTLEAA